jgi:hypothetical protein
MTTNNRTLDIDRLFVRDIVFRDASNRPISSNKTLTTRGDGGIYFKDSESGRLNSFNTLQAGANIKVEAAGATNTLWLEPGPGISYASYIEGQQPKIYISATAPEQITVRGGDTLKFTSLHDSTDGGKTLYFAGEGDTKIAISDATVVFGSAFNSSYSSIVILTSTTQAIMDKQTLLLVDITTTLGQVNTALAANNLTAITTAVNNAVNIGEKISSFVYSTFSKDLRGNNTILNVDYINTHTISTNSLQTSTINVGTNAISNSNYPEYCTVTVNDGIVTTHTNLLTFQDSVTGVKNGFEKEYMKSVRAVGTTSYETHGQQVQQGFYPIFSTQGVITPSNPNGQFVPIIQQIEVVQKTVQGTVNNGLTSTQTNYSMRNIGRFDDLCAAGDAMRISGNIVISTVIVSTINGKPFGTGEIYFSVGTGTSLILNDLQTPRINGLPAHLSTFSTLYWSTATGLNATISTLRVSTIMGVDLPIMTFDMGNRRVGLNLGATLQPRATMDVNGIVYADNFVTSSDRRLKTNIRPLEAPLEIPQAYRYNWIEGGAADIGVMADEIEAVAPECIYTRPDGYKAVSYAKLVPVVLTLLRSLSARVAYLETQSHA